MRILTIVGKVDSRILAYPLARALSINGLTAIITEDGAYRRLYHGEETTGTVNGIDISVGAVVNDELMESLSDSGIPYDNIIVVSGNYIPSNSDGVIVCSGIDKSMLAKIEQEKKEPEQPKKKERAPRKKKGSPKEIEGEEVGEVEVEELVSSEVQDTEETREEPKAKPTEDIINIPVGIPRTECTISYEVNTEKGKLALQLKELAARYISLCEETKRIPVLADKNYVRAIVKIAAEPLGMDEKELTVLMNRDEYRNKGKVK